MTQRGSKRHLILVIALFLVAAVAAGCGRAATGGTGGATGDNAQIDGVPWHSFSLQPGDYFKYEVTDHPRKLKGWVSVQVTDKGEGKLEAKWEGEREDGLKLSATTTEKPEKLIVMARPALITSPVATPFMAAILSQWWEKVGGFEMKVGAQWSVVADEMVPAGFVVKVDGYCNVAGQKGFKLRMTAGEIIANESCVSPLIALPLQVRVNNIDSKVIYEARLLEYRPGKK